MINLNHSQDIRYLSAGMLYTPISCLVIFVSILNLLGLPNLRGYFSKDLVLEMMNYSNASLLVMTVLFINVFFTYYYTYQLFYYSFQSIKLVPYQNFHSPLLMHTFLLLIMRFSTLLFGFIFLKYVCYSIIFYPVPTINKSIPIIINLFIFSILYINTKLFTSNSPLLNYYFSNIIYLSNLILRLSSNAYYNLGFSLVKSLELGLFNYSLNIYLVSSFYRVSNTLFKLSSLSPIKVILFSIFFFLFIVFIILLNNIIYYIWLLLIKFHEWI